MPDFFAVFLFLLDRFLLIFYKTYNFLDKTFKLVEKNKNNMILFT